LTRYSPVVNGADGCHHHCPGKNTMDSVKSVYAITGKERLIC